MKARKLTLSILLLATGSMFIVDSAVMAQGVAKRRDDIIVNDDEFRDVANDLRCPTCTGLSVLDSDAAFSVQIKNEVKEQLAAGKAKDEILSFFTERYGPWILRAPPKQGVHLLAWVLPIAALIFGPLLIWFFVWTRRDSRPDDEGVTRSVESIVVEMNQKLDDLRKSAGGHS